MHYVHRALALCFLLSLSLTIALTQSPPPRHLQGNFPDSIVLLRWEHPETELSPISYKVYRGMEDFHSIILLGSTQDTTFDDATVQLHKLYHYGVTAVYPEMHESSPSNIIAIFTGPEDTTKDSNAVDVHITTEPKRFVIVNQLYQYDVDAVSNPADVPVCFHLEEAPEGMTIDSSTGLIQWTPTSLGVFKVEVEALPCDGREGEASQGYRLYVLSGSPAQVMGTVRNTSGEGLPDVKIILFDVAVGHFVFRAITDDLGHYSFPFVNPTNYFVRAKPQNEHYLPQWYNGASRISDATAVAVAEGGTVTVDFTLQQRDTTRFSLSGTVMDDASHPLAGAKVFVFRGQDDTLGGGDTFDDCQECHGEDRQAAETDGNGHYSLRLHQGTYIAAAFAEGFLRQYWDHKPTPMEADPIMVTQNIEGIDFNLHPRPSGTGVISGVIYNAADSSGLESHVVAFQKDANGQFTGFVACTESDDSTGQYELNHLPSGCYIVLAKNEDDFVPTFYNTSGGTPFLDNATCVAVTSGMITGIDIYVQPDSTDGLNSVAGQVSANTSGSSMSPESLLPIPGALITVTNATNNNVVASAISGQGGNFTAAGLPPGSYNVIFQKAGKVTASVPISLSYVNNAPTTTPASAQLGDAGSGQIGTMSVRSRWNMVSLPVTVLNPHRMSVFPTANSNAFHFGTSGGYQTADQLNYTEGYWLKFPSAQALVLAGTQRTSQVVPVKVGWNMIGSLSTPMSVSSIQQSQQGLISSSVFGYGGSYYFANTIEPGNGYWVKATANGTITLNSGSAVPKSTTSIISELSKLNSLTIRDADGNAQVLYFGNNSKIDLNKTELPPVALSEAYDVRFSSRRIAELHPSSIQQTITYAIILQAARTPLTITWSVKNADTKYALIDEKERLLTPSYMQSNGSIRISSPEVNRLVLKVLANEQPKEFILHQNFPNPFNPSTQITFDVPTTTTVTLKVYNLLGQEVATLLHNTSVEAGEQSITFDASKLSSGLYFYRLQAGSFVSVRKMVLLK